jgi:hypothetical protein
LYAQLYLRGPIPVHIEVRPARSHDVLWLGTLILEPGAFYLLDRAYMNFKRLANIPQAGAFFVTQAKDNLRFSRFCYYPKVFGSGVRRDQIRQPTLPKARDAFPWPLRTEPFCRSPHGQEVRLSHQLSRGDGYNSVAALHKNH